MKEIMERLSDFDKKRREEALFEIMNGIKEGNIRKQSEITPWLNLHIHTFHSYNCYGWSPSRVVFEGWKTGLKYVGTVDFDTLAALEETLFAGEVLGVATTGGFETRVFIEEKRDIVINSPREPGIYYLCGKGFKKMPKINSEAGILFQAMQQISWRRNQLVTERLNTFFGELEIDYERDVLPLTPSGNPTERHLMDACLRKSEKALLERVDIFWANILEMSEEMVKQMRNEKRADFAELMRKKLIKYGGPGYIVPEKEHFPSFDKTVQMIEEAGGIPTGTWLDGTSTGENPPEEFIEFLQSKSIRAMTIIPDRNYNIADPREKERKIKNLEEFMDTCIKMKMPVVCGTEMNKQGQPFVDDFNNPAIARYLSYFLSSARVFF